MTLCDAIREALQLREDPLPHLQGDRCRPSRAFAFHERRGRSYNWTPLRVC